MSLQPASNRPRRHLAPVPANAEPVRFAADAGADAETVDLKELFGVVRRHWLLILGVAALVTGVVAQRVFTAPPLYRAEALLRLADGRRALTSAVGSQTNVMDQAFGRATDPVLSQIEVLRGRSVLGQVVDSLGLRLTTATPEVPISVFRGVVVSTPAAAVDSFAVSFRPEGVHLRGPRAEARGPYGAPVQVEGLRLTVVRRPAVDKAVLVVVPRERVIDALTQNVEAQRREKTDAIQVQFASSNPEVAQRVVNTTLTVYQRENALAAQQASTRRRRFLEEQLRITDAELASMQTVLSDFRRRERVYSSQQRFSDQQQSLTGLELRREELAADRQMYAAVLARVEGSRAERVRALRTLSAAPEVSSNQVIRQLYLQWQTYQSARDSLTAGPEGSTAANPQVERLESLIASAEERLLDALRSYVASLDGRIAALRSLQERNSSEIEALPSSEAEEVRLVQHLASAQKVADHLREELQKARMAEAVEMGEVEIVYAAPLPTEPIGSGRRVKLVLGLILGLMVGCVGAFARENMNTSIRRQNEIADLLHIPGLALIPRFSIPQAGRRIRVPALFPARAVRPAAPSGVSELVTLSDPHSAGAEAYRMLRTNLIFSQAVHKLRTLVVTSAVPGDGKSTTAANLAVVFAQQGLRVLLADCDLRRSRAHAIFGLPKEPGFTELVLGRAAADQACQPTSVEGLWLLAAGTLPPNPAELLGGEAAARTVDALARDFDLVIIDTPPLLAASDAAILATRADGVALVVRAGRTDRAAAERVVQQLHGVGARVVGAVLNDPDGKSARLGESYGYYSSYGYAPVPN